MKRLLADPSLLLLLAGNAWCIWYFTNHPTGFSNIIWIYWMQSVIIGLFNFVELLGVEKTDDNIKISGSMKGGNSKGCIALFFLFHYGVFHFVYMVFLLFSYHSNIDLTMILLVAGGFMLESFMSFHQRKKYRATASIGGLFFLPYLRVIPMHLTILLPSFLHITPSVLFLVLKTVADVGFHFIYHALYQRRANGVAGEKL